jgi:hypothetical protein
VVNGRRALNFHALTLKETDAVVGVGIVNAL